MTSRDPQSAVIADALRVNQTVAPPLLAIVGRPNVGKSSLFNRLVGSRRAIVGDEPGITRDRLYGETEWHGRALRVVDTGGIIPEDKDLIPSEIYRQANVALEEAAAIVLVVDGRTEIAAPDLELARLLCKTGKPLFLAVNKIDSDKQIALTGEFHRLGVKEIFPVSAENGRGIDDLLDAVLATLPPENQLTTEDTKRTKESSARPVEAAGTVTAAPTTNDQGPTTGSQQPTAHDRRPLSSVATPATLAKPASSPD